MLLFALLAGLAAACQQRCLSCRNETCALCVDSLLANGRCLPITYKVANCLFYSADERCSGCRLGFYLTTEGECEPIAESGCLELFKFKTCSMCRSPMRIRNGACDPSAPCETVNCQLCTVDQSSREVCFLCRPGSVLRVAADGRTLCVMGADQPENCHVGGPEGSVGCQVCLVGSYMVDGKCLEADEYSLTFQSMLAV